MKINSFAPGYLMASQQDFEDQITTLTNAGVEVTRGDSNEAKRRAVAEFASFNDPSATMLKFVIAARRAHLLNLAQG